MDYNYDESARDLLEEAEWLAQEHYKREFLGTECLLMAVVKTPGEFSRKLAEHGISEAQVNGRILQLMGREDLRVPASKCPPVGAVRLILHRANERALKRDDVTKQVTVGDITIELLKSKEALAGELIRKPICLANLDLLIEELVKLNGDPEEDSGESQTTFQEMEEQLRAS